VVIVARLLHLKNQSVGYELMTDAIHSGGGQRLILKRKGWRKVGEGYKYGVSK